MKTTKRVSTKSAKTPRAVLLSTAKSIFPGRELKIVKSRPKGKRGSIVVQLLVDGEPKVTGSARELDIAYKQANIELAKLWCF